MYIFAWVIWGLACAWLVLMVYVLVGSRDYGPRFAMGIYVDFLFAGILVTGMTSLSKLHLLWFAPVAYVASLRLGVSLMMKMGREPGTGIENHPGDPLKP